MAIQIKRVYDALDKGDGRRILVDRARQKLSAKRGMRAEHVPMEHVELASETSDDKLLQVHEALSQLAAEDAHFAKTWADLSEFREGYATWFNNIYLPRPR